ncbi:hypothetical protein H0H93_000151 [Arthromyces matolae]|nr:hypothetical protein H0H93_000151 [Arthromyces matolae]
MPAHSRVTRWLNERYRKPRVDPQWLDECYEWAINSKDVPLDPEVDFDELMKTIEYQLLESSFNDSMLPGTGLPINIAHTDTKIILTGQEIHVEVIALTEIGHSAFSMDQTRLAREERRKEGNSDDNPDEEGDIDVAGGPMPKYSRAMLHFQLTDGATTVPAIEYRPLPQLSLQDTPLGFKMLLKNVQVHKGIVWLEPDTVEFVGHKTEERERNRESDFARTLRARMRRPEPLADSTMIRPGPAMPPPAPPPVLVRSPLREISPPRPPMLHHGNDDEDLDNRRRRVPVRNPNPPLPSWPTAPSSTNRTVATTSSYFTVSSTSTSQTLVNSQTPFLSLSPTIRQAKPTLPTPTSIESEEDHLWLDENIDNFRQSPGVRTSQRQKVTQGEDKVKGKQNERTASSDEYEDDTEYDNDAFAKMDAMERAMETSSNPHPPSTINIGSGSSSAGTGARGHDSNDAITIEDSDDDDKENRAVPTRHVRRRIDHRQSSIIELTDSE